MSESDEEKRTKLKGQLMALTAHLDSINPKALRVLEPFIMTASYIAQGMTLVALQTVVAPSPPGSEEENLVSASFFTTRNVSPSTMFEVGARALGMAHDMIAAATMVDAQNAGGVIRKATVPLHDVPDGSEGGLQ